MIKINIFNYNKSGNNEKNVIKDKPKQIIKKIGMLILKKLILILLPVAMIMIIISAATWYLFQDEGTWDDKEKGNPSTYTKGANISGSDGITVDKSELVKKNLLNMGYTEEEIANFTDEDIIRIFRIKDKLGKTVTSLDELTHAELLWCLNDAYARYLKKVDDLEYLLNAELVTQYPKIDNLSEDKLNGIVTFERHQVDPDTQAETVKTLKYVSSDEFSKLFEDYKKTGKNDIFDYFTLDDSGNAKIATWIREEGNYTSNNTTSQNDRKKIRNGVTTDDITGIDERYAVQNNNADSINASYTSYYISEQSINYKSMIQQYTLPFEYLWSLLVMGDSSDFALKLAQLAYNSEIKIGVYDNIVKTIETNTEKYAEQFKERYRYYEDGSLVKKEPTDTEWKEEQHDYEHINVVTTYTDTVQIEVMHANTWAVEVTVNYNNTVTNGDGYENEVPGSDEEWDTSDSTYRSWTESSGSEEDGTEETISCEEYYDKHKRTINKSNISKLETVNSTYQKEPSEIKEKTDTDENTDMNFVKLFKDDYNVRTNLSNPSTVNWLISILENNEDTNNMVDLTKYLIYKATGHDYGVTSYDFSEYEFISFGGTGGSLSLINPILNREDFIAAMKAYSNKISGSKKTNFDTNFLPYAGEIYDWSKEYGVNPELVVVTACTENAFSCKSNPYNYWGIGVVNGSSKGKSFSSLKDGIKGYAEVIKSYQTGSKAERIKALATERQAAGVDSTGYGAPDTLSGMQSLYSYLGKHIEGSSGAGGYYYMDPAIAGVTKIYKTHEEFLSLCKNSGKSEHAHGTETTVWEQGQYTAWQVEQKLDVWNYIFGDYGSLYNGNSEIIEIAKSKLGCPYIYGAKGPNSFDCSGLVYWVYEQIGIEVPGSTAGYKTYINSTNEIDWSDAQPGDILIIFGDERGKKDGHAGIYLGNDEYIHAPQTGDVVKISSGASKVFKHVFRFQ